MQIVPKYGVPSLLYHLVPKYIVMCQSVSSCFVVGDLARTPDAPVEMGYLPWLANGRSSEMVAGRT